MSLIALSAILHEQWTARPYLWTAPIVPPSSSDVRQFVPGFPTGLLCAFRWNSSAGTAAVRHE